MHPKSCSKIKSCKFVQNKSEKNKEGKLARSRYAPDDKGDQLHGGDVETLKELDQRGTVRTHLGQHAPEEEREDHDPQDVHSGRLGHFHRLHNNTRA